MRASRYDTLGVPVLVHAHDGAIDHLHRRIIDAVADFQLADRLSELLGEPVIDALLDQQSVRADAGLSSVAVLRRHRALHRRVEIGVVENETEGDR